MSRVFTEVYPNCWRFVDVHATPVSHSVLPRPYVISDEMEATEQVDGMFYTSKAKFRAIGRALGLTEVGNEKFKPKTRGSITPENRRKRRQAFAIAIEHYKQGRRANAK